MDNKSSCINVRGLASKWKQTCLLDNIRTLKIDICVVTESKLSGPQAFTPLLNGYEKLIFPSQWDGGGVAVSSRKSWTCRQVQSF